MPTPHPQTAQEQVPNGCFNGHRRLRRSAPLPAPNGAERIAAASELSLLEVSINWGIPKMVLEWKIDPENDNEMA